MTDTETAVATVPQAEIDEARWLLPVYAHTPVEPVWGEGVTVHTRDGRALLDFYGGHAVACWATGIHGCCRPWADRRRSSSSRATRCPWPSAPGRPSGWCASARWD